MIKTPPPQKNNPVQEKRNHLFTVLRVGEVNQIIIIHFLGVDDVTVLFLTEIFGVDAVGPEKFLVGHAERLSNRLSYQLSLREKEKKERGQPLWGTTASLLAI